MYMFGLYRVGFKIFWNDIIENAENVIQIAYKNFDFRKDHQRVVLASAVAYVLFWTVFTGHIPYVVTQQNSRKGIRIRTNGTHTRIFSSFSSIYTNGNWQWCKREVGHLRHVASCGEPNDPSGWNSVHTDDTWRVWHPYVCDNGGSVHRISQNATRILPRNICTVFLLKQ